MQRILEQLFNGEICPNERTRISSGEYETVRNTAIQAHDVFEDKLSAELKKELDEVFSKDSAVNSLYNVQYFADGFKLGARLMLEILEVRTDD